MIRMFFVHEAYTQTARASVRAIPTYLCASTTRTLYLTIHDPLFRLWRRQRAGLMILTSGRETNRPTNPE